MSMDEATQELLPIRRQESLGDQAYQALKEAIIGGMFEPGYKLTVRTIAEQFAVSTTPARDAIHRLINDGAVVYAGPKTVILPQLSLDDFKEVTSIRIALEGLAAELCVAHISDEDVSSLLEMQARLNQALDRRDYRAVLSANRDFHFMLYQRSRLPRLVAMIESLWLRIGPTLIGLYPDFAVSRRGVSNHLMAIDGLEKRDPAMVRNAMQNDIRDGFERLQYSVDRRERK